MPSDAIVFAVPVFNARGAIRWTFTIICSLQALGDGTMLLCGESHVRSVRPTFHRDESRFEEPTSFMQLSKDSTSRRLVCWRVHVEPKKKHILKQLQQNMQIPYACVSVAVHKENLKNQMNDRHISAAWYVQIPIMVPMWKTADGGAVSTLKSNGLDALASKVTAVLRRWGVLENVAPHRCCSTPSMCRTFPHLQQLLHSRVAVSESYAWLLYGGQSIRLKPLM